MVMFTAKFIADYQFVLVLGMRFNSAVKGD